MANSGMGRVVGLPTGEEARPSAGVRSAESKRVEPSSAANGPAPGESNVAADRYSIHCYAGKGALCWEPGRTRGKDAEPTVFLQAAPAISERVYSWKEKIIVQLSYAEMQGMLAVIRRIRPSFEAKGHGEKKDKGFSIEDQGDKFFVKMFQTGAMRAIPMELTSAMEVAVLLTQQLTSYHNRAGLTPISDMALLNLNSTILKPTPKKA